ncbi:bone morphogenetic protein 3-like [Pecten maximus]|uniref:bone morphogenetic protein 3-like n=1 Tax=Pecten maximus TaxID=6579 RepID=UPI0014586C10|nr:bone morphogenetic protein 3-like [Pecten maximus]
MFPTVNLTVWLAVLTCVVLSREASEGPQNVLLNEAVKTLLGFKDELPRNKLSFPYGVGQEAPKYMLDLYDRFRNSQISKGHLSGNTVRSIHAEIAEVNGEEMFVFNLTSIIPSERLLSAEIHLYKRKMKKARRRRRDLELLMYEIAPHYMTENGKITMRAESFGWQWYDVTDAALSCLAARRDTPHLFALKFQVEKHNGKVRDVALKKFIRHHSMPFLIIYSNDTQNNELEPLENLAEKMHQEKKEDSDFVSSNTDSFVEYSLSFANGKFNSEIDSNDHSQDQTSKSVQRRQKRSIYDNEIPETPKEYENFHRKFNIPQTHPDILQSRRESRHKISDSRLIPYPDEDRRKNRKNSRKNRKNRRKNRRRKNKNANLLFPKEWDRFRGTGTEENKNSNICSKRQLILDFADIGWEDKIIAPKSFEAHYCAGSCPFPLTKKLRPSNHATIQSMVHAIGIHTDVPAPCCVPESLSSITLLFFDSNRNVVLKNYPSMSVKACGCR